MNIYAPTVITDGVKAMADKMTRLLVCGGRTFGWEMEEYKFIIKKLNLLSCEYTDFTKPEKYLPDIVIIEGGAKGVDNVALDWALCNFCTYETYEADWTTHNKATGPIRNRRILEEGKPDLVVAFPGGKGTANMVKQAKQAGIKVIEFAYE